MKEEKEENYIYSCGESSEFTLSIRLHMLDMRVRLLDCGEGGGMRCFSYDLAS